MSIIGTHGTVFGPGSASAMTRRQPQDSTGKPLKPGDRVRWRQQGPFTIAGFIPAPGSLNAQVIFVEHVEAKLMPMETEVDLVEGADTSGDAAFLQAIAGDFAMYHDWLIEHRREPEAARLGCLLGRHEWIPLGAWLMTEFSRPTVCPVSGAITGRITGVEPYPGSPETCARCGILRVIRLNG